MGIVLKIKIDPFGENTYSCEEARLAAMGPLGNLIRDNMVLRWAGDFFDLAYREINEPYSVEMVAEEFERRFFGALSKQYPEYCCGFSADKFGGSLGIRDRYENLHLLCREKGILKEKSFPDSLPALKVYTEGVRLDQESGDEWEYVENIHDADLTLFSEINNAREIGDGARVPGIALVPSEREAIHTTGTGWYVWEIPGDQITEIIRCVRDHLIAVPLIREMAEVLRTLRSDPAVEFSAEEEERLARYSSTDGIITVGVIPELEVGKTFIPEYHFTEDEDCPVVRMESLDNGVVEIAETGIRAVGEGLARIRFFRESNPIPFAVKTVLTYRDRSAKEIVLIPEKQLIGTGETIGIEMHVTPVDSEDANSISWSVSDPAIASIDDQGILTGWKKGTVVITASGNRTSGHTRVEIRPRASSIHVHPDGICIYRDEVPPVLQVSVGPEDCIDKTYSWQSTNPGVAVADDQGFVTVKGIGKCDLICSLMDGEGQASCSVEIKTTFDRNEKQPLFSMAAVFMVATWASLLLHSVLPMGAGTWISTGCAVGTILFGLASIAKYGKKVTVWAVILMIVGTLPVVGQMLIP